jgi:hypothetical protein
MTMNLPDRPLGGVGRLVLAVAPVRSHQEQERVIDAYAAELRDEVDLESLRSTLIVAADEAVRPASANVWLRTGLVGDK